MNQPVKEFYKISCMQVAVWTIFEHFWIAFSQGERKLETSREGKFLSRRLGMFDDWKLQLIAIDKGSNIFLDKGTFLCQCWVTGDKPTVIPNAYKAIAV